MAITHVASSAWAYSVSSVTPSLPTGTAVGDLVILFLVSKYDDASIGTPPAGWFDMGAVSNTGRSTGNDNGNLRGRAFYKVWQSGDSIPTLNPTPNNVSAAKVSTYRIPSGSLWEIAGAMVADNTTGTPLAFVTGESGLGLMANDVLHVDFGLNSDVATFGGATTVTTTGVTFGTVSTTTADSSTASGTDMRNRSIFVPVTSTTTPSGNITVSTALGGTTTNSVGVALIARIRESIPTPKSASDSSSIAVSESSSVTSIQSFSSLTDSFSDTVVDQSLWTKTSNNVTESNGTLNIYTPTSTEGVTSVNAYILDDANGVVVEVIPDSISYVRVSLVDSSPAFYVDFDFELSTLRFTADGSTTTAAYNSTEHRFIKFHRSGIMSLISTSPDGTSWSTQRSVNNAAIVSRLAITNEAPLATANIAGVNSLSTTDTKAVSDSSSISVSESAATFVSLSSTDTSGVSVSDTSSTQQSGAAGFTFVKESVAADNVGATSLSVVTGSGITNGNLVVLVIGVKDWADATTGITGGGTWTRAVQTGGAGGTSQHVDIWYSTDVPNGTTTLTATYASSTRSVIHLSEWQNPATSNLVDVVNTGALGTGTSATLPQFTPTGESNLAIAAVQFAATTTSVSARPTGFTNFTSGNVESAAASGSGTEIDVVYKNPSGTTALDSGWTLSASVLWGTAAAVFRPSGVAATPISGSETNSLSVTESTSIVVTSSISASDSAAVSVTDSSVITKNLAGSETPSLSVSEARTISITSASTESASIGVSDSRSLQVVVAGTDTASITSSESTSGFANNTASDSTSISLTEVRSISSALPGNENANIGIAEVAVISSVGSTTDAAALAVGESSSILISDTKSASDSSSIIAADSSALLKTIVASDENSLSLTEATSSQRTFILTDSVTVSIGEVSSLGSTLPGLDSAPLSATESVTNAVTQPVSDTSGLSIGESASVLANDGRNVSDQNAIATAETVFLDKTIVSGDTSALAVTEATATFVTRGVNDSASVSTTENSNISSTLPGTEVTTIGLTESRVITVSSTVNDNASILAAETTVSSITVSSSDAAGIFVMEQSGGDNSKYDDDTSAVIISESATLVINATLTSSEITALSATEFANSFADRPGTDQALLTLTEASSIEYDGVIEYSDDEFVSVLTAEATETLVIVASSDGTAISAVEVPGGDRTLSANDWASLSVSEVTESHRTIVVGDSAQIIVAEARSFEQVPASANDTLTVSVSESAIINIARPGTDADILSVTESSSVESNWAARTASESVSVSMGEQTSSSLATTRSDNNSLSVSEAVEFAMIPTSATENSAVSVSENVALGKTLEATDELPLRVLDIGDLFAAEGFFEKAVQDGATVRISDYSKVWHIGGKNVPINFGTKGDRGTITNTGGKSNIRFGSRAERSIRF